MVTDALPAVASDTVLVEADDTMVAWVPSRREFFALSPEAATLVAAITGPGADGRRERITRALAPDTVEELVHQLQAVGVLMPADGVATGTGPAPRTPAMDPTTGPGPVEVGATTPWVDDPDHEARSTEVPRLGPYAALSHHFVIEVDPTMAGGDRVPSLVAELRRVLVDLATDGSATEPARYRIVATPDRPGLWRDGTCLVTTTKPADVLATLLWDVNRRAVAATARDCLVLHAGAVVDHRGRAVVLPAAMEAGKTTLVTALVRAGFGYLSDELVAVPDPGGTVLAYPKALSIDPGSWKLFPELVPAAEQLHLSPDQWLVTADEVRDGAVHPAPSNPAVLVLPQHQPGASTELTPLAPLETVRDLAACAFGLGERPDHVLPRVAQVADTVPAFRLRVGDGTEEAVAAVRTALSRVPQRAGRLTR